MLLYTLKSEYIDLLNHIDDEDWDSESLIEMLNEVEGDIENKCISIACVIKNTESEIDALDAEIKRLTARKMTRKNTVERLKSYAYDAMKEVGMKTIDKDPRFKISYQKNPASVVILDESKVPEEYRTPQPDAIDKRGVLKWMKENGITDVDWAAIKQTESLRIR